MAGIGSRLGETHDSTGRTCCAVPEARCGRPPEERSSDGFGEEDETVEVVVFVFVFFLGAFHSLFCSLVPHAAAIFLNHFLGNVDTWWH